MNFVLDSSMTLSWYFEDERTLAADALLDEVTESGAIVPALWQLEVANGFQAAIRRKRIDAAFRDRALAQLKAMPITIDPETTTYAWTATLRLCDDFRLTPYDAAYLELAQRRRLPLATLDRELLTAAQTAGTATIGQ